MIKKLSAKKKGGVKIMKKNLWSNILKVVIAVATAIAGVFGVNAINV